MDDRLVMLFIIQLAEVPLQVCARSVYLVEVIGGVPWGLEFIFDAI